MNTQPLTIEQIDDKIRMFQDGLTRSFVPADEKEHYKSAIAKLEAQKKDLQKGSATRTESAIPVNAFQQTGHNAATRDADYETCPDDAKKKSLRTMLALWKDRLLNALRWLAPAGKKQQALDRNNPHQN